jgi:hypothetical protein
MGLKPVEMFEKHLKLVFECTTPLWLYINSRLNSRLNDKATTFFEHSMNEINKLEYHLRTSESSRQHIQNDLKEIIA